MGNVIGDGGSRNRRNRAPATSGAAVGIADREVEAAFEPSPGQARGGKQIADVLSEHFIGKFPGPRANVAERLRVADQRKSALSVGNLSAGAIRVHRRRFVDAVGLAGNQVDGAGSGWTELCVVG